MPSPPLRCSCLIAVLLASLSLSNPTLAAKPAKVTVDGKGVLKIPVATLKSIGVKPDRDGSVWMQFPAPPAPKVKLRIPLAIQRPQPRDPIRILTVIDRGAAKVSRTRVDGGHLPGAPGTVYLATGSTNTIILTRTSPPK